MQRSFQKGVCPLLLVVFCTACYADDAPKPPAQVQAETDKAIYDAKKAKYDAETAAATAKVGTLSTYSTPGDITTTSSPGKLEATLMYAEVARKIAARIVEVSELKNLCNAGPHTILVVGASEKLSFDAYDAYEAQRRSIKSQLERALNEKLPDPVVVPPPQQGAPSPVGTTGIAATGTFLNVAANLLRSDYKIEGIEISTDESALVASVASEAAGMSGCTTIAPSVFFPKTVNDDNPAVMSLSALSDSRDNANTTLNSDNAHAGAALKQAGQTKGAASEKAKAEAARYAQRIADLTAAIKRFDDFYAKLGTPDSTGALPLAIAARQAKYEQLLANGFVLSVKASFAGGAEYSKKNFWTFLGAMPFYVSGGGVANFALVDGPSGAVRSSGVIGYSVPFSDISNATRRYQAPESSSMDRGKKRDNGAHD